MDIGLWRALRQTGAEALSGIGTPAEAKAILGDSYEKICFALGIDLPVQPIKGLATEDGASKRVAQDSSEDLRETTQPGALTKRQKLDF